MSKAERDRATERMASDEAFAAAVRSDPRAALAGYDLTDEERQALARLETAVPPTPTTAPAPALGTRRSKSSMLGIGAVTLAAAGAVTYGVVKYTAPSYSRSMTVNSSAESLSSVALGTSATPDVTTIAAPAAGTLSTQQMTVVKTADSLDTQLRQAQTNATPVDVTITVNRNGSPWEVYQLTHALITQFSTSALSSSSTQQDTITFSASSITLSYPNGP